MQDIETEIDTPNPAIVSRREALMRAVAAALVPTALLAASSGTFAATPAAPSGEDKMSAGDHYASVKKQMVEPADDEWVVNWTPDENLLTSGMTDSQWKRESILRDALATSEGRLVLAAAMVMPIEEAAQTETFARRSLVALKTGSNGVLVRQLELDRPEYHSGKEMMWSLAKSPNFPQVLRVHCHPSELPYNIIQARGAIHTDQLRRNQKFPIVDQLMNTIATRLVNEDNDSLKRVLQAATPSARKYTVSGAILDQLDYSLQCVENGAPEKCHVLIHENNLKISGILESPNFVPRAGTDVKQYVGTYRGASILSEPKEKGLLRYASPTFVLGPSEEVGVSRDDYETTVIHHDSPEDRAFYFYAHRESAIGIRRDAPIVTIFHPHDESLTGQEYKKACV